MKVYKTTRPLTIEEVKSFLDSNLDTLFEKRRQVSLHFKNVLNDNSLEINNVQNYDSFLFRIIFKDDQIDVIKSGNYTDDINALAIEYILEEYFSANGINYVGGEN